MSIAKITLINDDSEASVEFSNIPIGEVFTLGKKTSYAYIKVSNDKAIRFPDIFLSNVPSDLKVLPVEAELTLRIK